MSDTALAQSNTPTVPLFLRKYKLTITIPGKTYTIDSNDEPALRFTFEVNQRWYQVFWAADIAIYNLSAATVNDIMAVQNWQDIQVTVEAGYKSFPNGYGTIWDGPVFQLLFEREQVVDTKLTLHCLIGLSGQQQPVFQEYTNILQPDLIRQLASKAQIPVASQALSSQISTKPLSRPKAVFGSASHYFTRIAEGNNMQWFHSKAGLNFSSITDDDIPTSPSLTFTPPSIPAGNQSGPPSTSTSDGIIIGTPQQDVGGVRFTALLDARVQISKPCIMIKIDNTLIRQMKAYANSPNVSELTVLDQDGFYIVIGARFFGDSRGVPWYVEINGLTRAGSKTKMMLLETYNTNRGQS